ncbi:hypothetical protein CWI39_2731p0010 [Hamiltosporidium magnivora]|uniref:Uncharacterized protein n=1 Tax=Hamiltosporidium magnivora TaxID=148818 RepID=A0A4V2JTW3_9MICR|nr:hypothetical protein CWI39_2731p0010 [Hamiltosporidium magnivora]TBU00366.1 hypothetical protein CWI36_1662p0010 [Hamiltosporidium magnivora]
MELNELDKNDWLDFKNENIKIKKKDLNRNKTVVEQKNLYGFTVNTFKEYKRYLRRRLIKNKISKNGCVTIIDKEFTKLDSFMSWINFIIGFLIFFTFKSVRNITFSVKNIYLYIIKRYSCLK